MLKTSVKVSVIILGLSLVLSGCMPASQADIEKAIQQTQTIEAIIKQAIQKTQSAQSPISTYQTPVPSGNCGIRESEKPSWKVSVCDSFDSNTNSMWIGSKEYDLTVLRASISLGKYKFYMKFKPYGHFTGSAFQWFTIGNITGDYLVQLDGEIFSKNRDVFWGLGVRGSSTDDYYSFIINDIGGFSITHLSGEFLPIVAYGTNGSIKWGEINNIKAIAEGKTISFYVNDDLIKTITSNSNSAPNIFLVLAGAEGTEVDYEFDNLLIKSR